MNVIQQPCEKHHSLAEAQDHLHGLSHLPGFVFGYVDEKENQPVGFFLDGHPHCPLQPGQKRRTIVFAHKQPSLPGAESGLAAIADAISKGTDLTTR